MSLINLKNGICLDKIIIGIVFLITTAFTVEAHFESAEDAKASYDTINKKIESKYGSLDKKIEKTSLETRQSVLSLTQMIIENRIGEVQKRRATASKSVELDKLRRDYEGNYDKLRFINQKLENIDE